MATLKSGKPYWRGRISTVDPLIKIGWFVKKEIYSYSLKSIWSKLVSKWDQQYWSFPFSKASLLRYNGQNQGKLKGEVSLYHWPPVWLVWNQLYDYCQFLFLFAKQTNPNQSNKRSTVQCPNLLDRVELRHYARSHEQMSWWIPPCLPEPIILGQNWKNIY
jgi:hypothetical protein